MSAVFDPLRLSAVALDVLAASHTTPAAIARRQRLRLAALLGAAQRGSRLYRERLHGVDPARVELVTLPHVTRHELMQRFDDWVTEPRLRLPELCAFTADPQRVAEPYLGRFVVWESSGTAGAPGLFVQDAQAMAVYDALEALRRSPPSPLQRWLDPLLLNARVAFVGATGGHFASCVSMQRLRQLNPWLAPILRSFSILQSSADLLAQLQEFRPTIISTYPTAAAQLAGEAAQGRLAIAPREVWTGGETLSAALRRCIEAGLGCTLRNSYGASEFLPIGWECEQGRLHVNADWVILEPVDEHHKPVPAGQPSCSTLLTNLANHVQPLIRYDLGDQITLGAAPCACGSPLPVIDVRGRCDDALVMAGRQGRPVTLLPLALTTVLEDEAGLFDFQLRQRDQHTLVLRLPGHGATAAAALGRGRSALCAFARVQDLASLQVVGELGCALARGRSGKVQRVLAARAGQRAGGWP